MAALSYKARFVEFVERGLQTKPTKGQRIKRKTIRNFRKHLIKKGDTLHHFFGMRTKWCRKLGTSTCKSVRTICINHRVVFVATEQSGYPEWKGNYREITSIEELDKFAQEDGFEGWADMKHFWLVEHGEDCFPFIGQLIEW